MYRGDNAKDVGQPDIAMHSERSIRSNRLKSWKFVLVWDEQIVRLTEQIDRVPLLHRPTNWFARIQTGARSIRWILCSMYKQGTIGILL